MILIIFLIIVAFILFRYILKPYIQYRKYKKFGDGQFFPIIGELKYQMAQFEKNSDLEYHYKHMQDGTDGKLRVFVENIAGNVKVKICDPELLKDFFYQLNDNYEDDMFYVQNFERLLGKGLVFSTGEQWKRTRQILSAAFHFDYLKSLSQQIEITTENVLKSGEDKLDKVDTIAMMAEITSQVIIFSFFGDSLTQVTFKGQTLTQAITFILQKIALETNHLSFLLFGARFLEFGLFQEHKNTEIYLQEFRKFLKDIIDQNIESLTKEFKETGDIKKNCVLGNLIKEGNINKLTQKELIDNFMTLFVAGTDTTSHLVGMTIYYLSQNKEILKQLQKEVDSNTNKTPKGLLELPFLNAVLKETQRYYGPANTIFDRKAIKEHYIGDIKIEKGVIVNYLGNTIHRNEQYYKDPHSYNPHRWINGETNSLPSFTFVPFSGGKRNCIGQHLALIEARIMLSQFIEKYDFECEKDYKLKLFYGLVPQPEIPLQINLSLRKLK